MLSRRRFLQAVLGGSLGVAFEGRKAVHGQENGENEPVRQDISLQVITKNILGLPSSMEVTFGFLQDASPGTALYIQRERKIEDAFCIRSNGTFLTVDVLDHIGRRYSFSASPDSYGLWVIENIQAVLARTFNSGESVTITIKSDGNKVEWFDTPSIGNGSFSQIYYHNVDSTNNQIYGFTTVGTQATVSASEANLQIAQVQPTGQRNPLNTLGALWQPLATSTTQPGMYESTLSTAGAVNIIVISQK